MNDADWAGNISFPNEFEKYFYFDNEPVSYLNIEEGLFTYPLDGNGDAQMANCDYSGGALDYLNDNNQSFYSQGKEVPNPWNISPTRKYWMQRPTIY